MRTHHYFGPTPRLDGAPWMLYNAFRRIPDVRAHWYECTGTPELFGKTDLHIAVDWAEDTLGYEKFVEPRPLVYWMSDTHVTDRGRAYRMKKSQRSDHVYCAIWSDANAQEHRTWLPYAVEPLLYRPRPDIPVTYDVGFTGHISNYPEREIFLEQMFEAFPSFTVDWGKYMEQNVEVLSRCRVVLNHCQTNAINQRLLEGMAMGKVVLTNRTDDLAMLGIQDGVHCVTYQTPEEAVRKTKNVLDDPGLLGAIGKNAVEFILGGHTYLHRAVRMIRDVTGLPWNVDIPALMNVFPGKDKEWGNIPHGMVHLPL